MAARRKRMNGSDGQTDAQEYPGLEHWRGTVDEKLKNIAATVSEVKADVKSNMEEVKRSIESMGKSITDTLREVDTCGKQEHQRFEDRISILEEARNRFAAKVSIIAGFAGIVGGGVSSATFSTLFHKIFG